VHVPGLATNECFVHFNLTVQVAARKLVLHGKADSMTHEPSCLLSHTDSAVKLPGAIAVLTVGNHPGSREPFVQSDRRVLKDRPNLDGELPLGVLGRTLPAPMLRLVMHFSIAATRARYTIWPSPRDQVVNAVLWIGEIHDSLLKGLGFAWHAASMP
jgi:hypothetical protein